MSLLFITYPWRVFVMYNTDLEATCLQANTLIEPWTLSLSMLKQ